MYSVNDPWALPMRVSTFGNLRIKGYVLLPAAYRSLSRPSSAPDAKAFSLRSFQLDLSIAVLIYQLKLYGNLRLNCVHLSMLPLFNGKPF